MGMMQGNHQRSAARPRLSAGRLGSSRTGDGISGGVWGWPDASRRVSLGNPGSDLAHNPNLNSPKSVRLRPGISKPVDVSNWAHGPRHLSWRTSFAVMIVCVNPTVYSACVGTARQGAVRSPVSASIRRSKRDTSFGSTGESSNGAAQQPSNVSTTTRSALGR